MNKYIIYSEKSTVRNNGVVCHSAEYTALANDEKEVRDMAESQGVDLTGYTIELERSNVKDALGRDYKPEFKAE